MKFRRFLCALVLALFTLQTLDFARWTKACGRSITFRAPRSKRNMALRLPTMAEESSARFGALQQRRFGLVCFAEWSGADQLSHRRGHR